MHAYKIYFISESENEINGCTRLKFIARRPNLQREWKINKEKKKKKEKEIKQHIYKQRDIG